MLTHGVGMGITALKAIKTEGDSDGSESDMGGLITNSGTIITPEGGTSLLPYGSSMPHENRPPYYALAYIIKL